MPIIPQIDESQKLVPSNPVPIRNSADARKEGDALTTFGEAISHAGDRLSAVSAATNTELKKTELMKSSADIEALAMKQASVARAAPLIKDDDTGQKQVDAYRQSLQDPINEYLNTISDPEQRSRIQAESAKIVNDYAKSVYANEVVKQTKALGELRLQTGGSLEALAVADPKEIPNSIAKYQVMVHESNDIAEKSKTEQIQLGSANILRAGIRGMLERSVQQGTNEFGRAMDTLHQYGTGILPEKDAEQLSDKIIHEQSNYLNQKSQRENLDDRAEAKNKVKVEADRVNMYGSALLTAGYSDAKRAPIIESINQDILSGVISEAKGKALLGAAVFKQAGGRQFENQIMSEAMTSGRVEDAISRVNAESGVSIAVMGGKDDGPNAGDLVARLRGLQKRLQDNPNLPKDVATNTEVLKNIVAHAMPTATDYDREMKTSQAVNTYYRMMEKKDADPVQTAAYALASVMPAASAGLASQESLQRDQEKLVKQYRDEQAKGNMTPERNRQLSLQLRELHLKVMSLQAFSKDPSQPQTNKRGQ